MFDSGIARTISGFTAPQTGKSGKANYASKIDSTDVIAVCARLATHILTRRLGPSAELAGAVHVPAANASGLVIGQAWALTDGMGR